MAVRGGYILHIDGTCEEASRVLLVCMDSLSMQVLESRKIESENHDQVRDVLREVRRDWGRPLAIVHDLRRALITAAGEVFGGVAQFVCHFHLAADVGKDILSPHVDRLRRVLRRTKVRAKLRQLVRSLKRFAICEDSGDHIVNVLLSLHTSKDLREHCTTESAKGVVHALACWILAFAQDGEGYGFPFDLPQLDFYNRIVHVHQMLDAAGPLEGNTRRSPLRELNQLWRILDVVVNGDESVELRQIVADTKRDRRVFERFRSVLRICPQGRQEEKKRRWCSKHIQRETPPPRLAGPVHLAEASSPSWWRLGASMPHRRAAFGEILGIPFRARSAQQGRKDCRTENQQRRRAAIPNGETAMPSATRPKELVTQPGGHATGRTTGAELEQSRLL
jgi:hypothetical protein